MEEPAKNSEKKVTLFTVVLGLVIVAAVYVITIGIMIWFFNFSKSDVIRRTAAVIPYPAAIVGTNVITFNKLMTELDAARQFYQNQNFANLGMQVDFSTSDGQKKLEVKKEEILEKLIENAAIENEAKKRGLNLTNAEVNQQVNLELKKYGSQDNLANTLQKLYGWNITQFEENIVKPDLYAQKLFADIQTTDPSYEAAKAKITEAQNKLRSGASFAAVAAQYSDGATAKNGGELGWFSPSQMLPEVATVISKMKVGEQSEIIQSSIGYHIVRLEAEKTENNIPMYKVSQIFVRTEPFSEWVATFEKQDRIWIPLREFKWNADFEQVEFRDPAMQNFQANLIKNSPNDPSVLF